MRLANHRKYPTRSYRNDYDFAFFGNSSLPDLSTRNAARFGGEFSADSDATPAESMLSGHAIASARTGFIQGKSGFRGQSSPVTTDSELASEPVFCYRATLFDCVMDFWIDSDRRAAQLAIIQERRVRQASRT